MQSFQPLTETNARPPVICLCGSLKFWDEMIQANAILVCKGIISVPSGFSMKYPEKFPGIADYVFENPEKMKRIFDCLHFQKIMMADAIWVLNVDDYIGDSTKREISFAAETGKSIFAIAPSSYCNEQNITHSVVPLSVHSSFPESLYGNKYAGDDKFVSVYNKYTSMVDGL